MVSRTTKLRWRRQLRRSRRQVEDLGIQAEEQLEQHFIRRLSKLNLVRRFVASWILLFVLIGGLVVYQVTALSGQYQRLVFTAGGTYTEGVLGSFTNANPLYATGAVDGAVARLVFAGLLQYDGNNQLTPDLAESWSVDERGTTYTVKLRPDVFWHDGKPLTASDVLFTYKTIQNPDAKSPLLSSWQGVKLNAPDARTIQFTLPNVLASFPYALTNGIVPQHILGGVPASQLRAVRFDTANPIGTGPFMWDAIQVDGDTPETRQEQIALKPYDGYHFGKPKLAQFKLRTFRDEQAMLKAFASKEITAMSGIDQLPDGADIGQDVYEQSIAYNGGVGVFFRNSHPALKDAKVRQALVSAVDKSTLLKGMPYPVQPLASPLLPQQIGYDRSVTQLPFNQAEATKLLDSAGWKPGKDGVRSKEGVPLSFRLYSQSTSEYAYVTKQLQKDWLTVGARVDVMLQSESDLQDLIRRDSGNGEHLYDALLYGISIGNDPDVFAYWHSSQASVLSSSRLNFSEYKSTAADKALEAGRTRIDPSLRAVKYRPFLESWRADAPAAMLYQPRYLYVTNTPTQGIDVKRVNTATDRYANVQSWMIRRDKVANQ